MLPSFVLLNIFSICILGFVTSYTDLKKGLIQNKFVFPAIALAFVLNFLNGFSFYGFLLNGFLAFLFGLLLWLASLWSAGDAKLFLAFALLFPMSFYDSGTVFPAFSILVNSFVPAFVFLLVLVISRTTLKQKKVALKESFKPGLVLSVMIYFFSLYWLLDFIFSLFNLQLDLFTTSILLFLIIAGVEILLPRKAMYFFAALSVIFFFYRMDLVLNLDFVLFFFSFLTMALVLLFVVLRLGISSFGKAVEVNDLKPGMVLLETVFSRKGIIEKKKPLLPSFVNIFLEIREKPLLNSGPTGISNEDIDLLKREKKAKKVKFGKLLVQETLPFAPIIFAGTVLSFLAPFFFAPLLAFI